MSFAFYINEILLINHGSNQRTDHVESRNKVVVLYNQKDEIIGYNLLDFKDESLKHGLVTHPTQELQEHCNEYLVQNDLPTIELQGVQTIVVGKVLTCENHPDSDHLHITTVDVKDEVLQIVCGAKNVQAGQKVVVAKVGTMMFDGTFIAPGVLRNVKSYGMICSGYELGLEGYRPKEGILVLDDSYVVGNQYFK